MPCAMKAYVLVALGGALGAAARHMVSAAALRWLGAGWPYGTLAVNVLGGLAMGLVIGWLSARGAADAQSVRLLLATGVLGGFTTFSAFSLEVVLMLERREMFAAAAYVGLSVLGAVLALMAGLAVARRVWA